MQGTQTLVFPLLQWVHNLLSLVASATPAGDDERDDVFDDDLDTTFGGSEEDDDLPDDDAEPSDDDDEEPSDDDDEEPSDDDDKSKKQDARSAIHQKKRYRDLYKKSQARIKELENKEKSEGPLSEEDKKEKAAEEFLTRKIREVLNSVESEKEREQQQQQEAFQEEMDEVLDENEYITEEQILELTNELDVSPRQAAKIIEREKKTSKKTKPKVPKEKRSSPRTKPKRSSGDDTPSTLDSVNRRIKEMLSRNEL